MKIYKYFPQISPKYPHFLSTLKIRFTQPAALNDPYECKPYIINYDDNIYNELYVDKVLQEESERILLGALNAKERDAQIKAFKTDMRKVIVEPEHFKDIYMRVINDSLNSASETGIGILSLSKRKDSPVMWAHYADKHKGYVVCFDTEDNYFKRQATDNPNDGILMKVDYDNTRISLNFQKRSNIPHDFFYRKSKDWSYEKELRIIRRLSSANTVTKNNSPYPVYLFDVPPSAIQEICLGMNIKKKDERKILSSVRGNKALSHVKIFKAALNDKSFKMDWISL